ncbi:MAG: hypothetical protein IPI35_35015, partial [Deltaproteobacteria bacterium]|nr:hypothetical protein [Deltaproteobacteria bacterium]
MGRRDSRSSPDEADVALGSRFLAADGGAVIPSWRRLGNRALTAYARRRLGIQATELHTGARAFRAEALRALPLEQLSDDYVFDQQVLVRLAVAGFGSPGRPARARCDESEVDRCGGRFGAWAGVCEDD